MSRTVAEMKCCRVGEGALKKEKGLENEVGVEMGEVGELSTEKEGDGGHDALPGADVWRVDRMIIPVFSNMSRLEKERIEWRDEMDDLREAYYRVLYEKGVLKVDCERANEVVNDWKRLYNVLLRDKVELEDRIKVLEAELEEKSAKVS